jgi:Cu/Zn superoxide dismutase
MRILTSCAAFAAAAALASLPALAQTNTMSSAMPAMQDATKNAVKVSLGAQNNSGETGTAFLIPAGDQTKVTVVMKGAPADLQPVHIHEGSCAKLNPKPAYPLTTLNNGKSYTLVNVPIAKLQSGGYAINVHKSTTDIGTYVSCGDIPKVGAM